MSWPRGRSRRGCSATSASSSTTSSSWRPSSRSASIRSSWAARRSSSSRAISGLREVRVSELRQRGAAPQSERLPQLLGGALGLATGPCAPCVLERVAEDVGSRARRSRGGGGSRGHASRALHPRSPASLAAVRRAPAASSAPKGEASRPRARRPACLRTGSRWRGSAGSRGARAASRAGSRADCPRQRFERAKDPRLHRAPRSWCSRLWLICSRRATAAPQGARRPTARGGRRRKERQ